MFDNVGMRKALDYRETASQICKVGPGEERIYIHSTGGD